MQQLLKVFLKMKLVLERSHCLIMRRLDPIQHELALPSCWMHYYESLTPPSLIISCFKQQFRGGSSYLLTWHMPCTLITWIIMTSWLDPRALIEFKVKQRMHSTKLTSLKRQLEQLLLLLSFFVTLKTVHHLFGLPLFPQLQVWFPQFILVFLSSFINFESQDLPSFDSPDVQSIMKCIRCHSFIV